MQIAIDLSPLTQGNYMQHKVRGSGFYLENLKKSLPLYDKKNQYTFFSRGEALPATVDMVHYPYFEPFFETLPFYSRQKTIVTVHDLIPLVFQSHFPKGIKGAIKWQMQKQKLKRTTAIITDSQNSKNDIARITGIHLSKIFVVYLSAGEEYKKITLSEQKVKKLQSKYNLPEKFALYVGDATWNKNLVRLVQAAELAGIPLVMVGKTLSEKVLDVDNKWNKDLVRVQEIINKSSLIIPLGFVPSSDLVALYNRATVFVMPSLYEGFGLPVLEAMSCGCPVITSQEGSLKEVAGDGAYFVNAYDVDAIAKGIKEVFSNSNLQKKLSESGFKNVHKYTWKKTAEETIKIYEKTFLQTH